MISVEEGEKRKGKLWQEERDAKKVPMKINRKEMIFVYKKK